MGTSGIQYYVHNENKVELNVLREQIEKAIPELTFLVAQSKNSDWIGVGVGVDEDFSCYDNYEKNLHVIHELSQSTVLGALIHDSDALALFFKPKGANQADYVDVGIIPSGHGKAKANLDVWQPFLRNDATVEQLVAAFESEPTFVEDALGEVLELLGVEDATALYNEILKVLDDGGY